MILDLFEIISSLQIIVALLRLIRESDPLLPARITDLAFLVYYRSLDCKASPICPVFIPSFEYNGIYDFYQVSFSNNCAAIGSITDRESILQSRGNYLKNDPILPKSTFFRSSMSKF